MMKRSTLATALTLLTVACGDASAPVLSVADGGVPEGAVASDGAPAHCGAAGEACCNGTACDPSLTCSNKICDNPNKTAGAPTVLATGLGAVVAVVEDGADVYWLSTSIGGSITGTNVGSIQKCAKTGCNGKPTTLVSGLTGTATDKHGNTGWPVTAAFAVDATSVYWIESPVPYDPFGTTSSIRKCSKNGANQTPTDVYVETGSTSLVQNLFVAGGNVYFARPGSNQQMPTQGTGAVQVCPVSGCNGAPKTIVAASGNVFAADANNNLYFDSFDGKTYSLTRLPMGGGASAALTPPGNLGSIFAMTTDATNLYFLGLTSQLESCPLAGCGNGQEVALAPPTGVASAFGLVLNGGYAYWGQPTIQIPFEGGVYDGGAVLRCPVSGCTSGATVYVPIGNAAGDYVGPFAVDATHLYVAAANGKGHDSKLLSYPK